MRALRPSRKSWSPPPGLKRPVNGLLGPRRASLVAPPQAASRNV